MSDRTLGYSVILFLLLFVFVPALYLSSKALTPGHKRTVVFDSINTGSFLRIQDGVRLKGLEVGQVKDIIWEKGKSVVIIETRNPLPIYEGYTILAEAKGLMGDRYMEINPGDPARRLIDKKERLAGLFPLGPTEAIAFMGALKGAVDSLVKVSEVFRDGSPGKPAFDTRFNSVIRTLDTVEVSLLTIFRKTGQALGENADSLAKVLMEAEALSRELNTRVPRAEASIESIIDKTENLLVAADSLAAQAGLLVEKVNGPEVMELNKSFVKLKAQIQTVRDFLIKAQKRGIVLPVKWL